jgi:hypothetical protein
MGTRNSEGGQSKGGCHEASSIHERGASSAKRPRGADGLCFDAPSFTQQLDQAGISWKSYQEDLDIDTTTGEVMPRSQWTAGIASQSGTLSDGNQNNYAVKYNPDPFFTHHVGATAANG